MKKSLSHRSKYVFKGLIAIQLCILITLSLGLALLENNTQLKQEISIASLTDSTEIKSQVVSNFLTLHKLSFALGQHLVVLTDNQQRIVMLLGSTEQQLFSTVVTLYFVAFISALIVGVLIIYLQMASIHLKVLMLLSIGSFYLFPFGQWFEFHPDNAALSVSLNTLVSFFCMLLIYFIAIRTKLLTDNHLPATTLIAYASQSGMAAAIAKKLSSKTPENYHLANLAEIKPRDLLAFDNALLIASTYGDGEPPHNTAAFFNRLIKSQVNLQHMNFSLLALGDRQYRKYCAFGHNLASQLQQKGANLFSPVVEVNRGEQTQVNQWWESICDYFGWHTENYEAQWHSLTVLSNDCLNPAKPHRCAHHLVLESSLEYGPGDLLEVLPPGATTPRVYSIASCPGQSQIELLVRILNKDNGQTGLASGYLSKLLPGQQVKANIRPHMSFHPPQTNKPLIMLAAGTGIAPFIGFLQQRQQQQSTADAWLFMGEQDEREDNYFDQQLSEFEQQGTLTKRIHAWSKSTTDKAYVQNKLQLHKKDVIEQVLTKGADIYICGSAAHFGQGVLNWLESAFSEHWYQLLNDNRIHRDLY